MVDRLWPRGMKKENAHVDSWQKEVAPSTELRKWFNHDPEKWTEFNKRYKAELKASGALAELRSTVKTHKTVTLLYGASDEQQNQAVVLQKLLAAPRHTVF